MIDFHITKILKCKNDIYFTMNKPVGINYMVYLTCQLKDNNEINIVDSEEDTIHFKIIGKDTNRLINDIKTLLV